MICDCFQKHKVIIIIIQEARVYEMSEARRVLDTYIVIESCLPFLIHYYLYVFCYIYISSTGVKFTYLFRNSFHF